MIRFYFNDGSQLDTKKLAVSTIPAPAGWENVSGAEATLDATQHTLHLTGLLNGSRDPNGMPPAAIPVIDMHGDPVILMTENIRKIKVFP